MKVFSIGEVLWDVFPTHRVWGGAPANFTFHASQFGAESAMASAIGNDEFGQQLIHEIKNTGISLFANETNYPTGISKVTITEEGHPDYTIVEPSAWDFIQLNHDAQAFAREADLICFGSLAQRSQTSRQTILSVLASKKLSAKVLFDVNIRQNYYTENIIENSLEYTDILKLNEVEADLLESLFKIDLKTFISHFKLDMIILTLGENGSQILTKHQTYHAPIYPCKVVDAVGAGDSFGASFIIQVLQGCEISKAQKIASQVAAWVCEHSGATIELPNSFKTSIGMKNG